MGSDTAPSILNPRVVFCWASTAGVAEVVGRERVGWSASSRVVLGWAGTVVVGGERVGWGASSRVVLGWAGTVIVDVVG